MERFSESHPAEEKEDAVSEDQSVEEESGDMLGDMSPEAIAALFANAGADSSESDDDDSTDEPDEDDGYDDEEDADDFLDQDEDDDDYETEEIDEEDYDFESGPLNVNEDDLEEESFDEEDEQDSEDWDYPAETSTPQLDPLDNYDSYDLEEEPKINGNNGSRRPKGPAAGRRANNDDRNQGRNYPDRNPQGRNNQDWDYQDRDYRDRGRQDRGGQDRGAQDRNYQEREYQETNYRDDYSNNYPDNYSNNYSNDYYGNRPPEYGRGPQNPPRFQGTPRPNPNDPAGGRRPNGNPGYTPGYPQSGNQWGQPQNGYEPWTAPQEWAPEPSPMDLNLVSNLVRWASMAKYKVGDKRLTDIIELYVESRSAPPGLSKSLNHIASIVDDQPPESGQSAQETMDLIAHLHGILTAALPVPSVPQINAQISFVTGNGNAGNGGGNAGNGNGGGDNSNDNGDW